MGRIKASYFLVLLMVAVLAFMSGDASSQQADQQKEYANRLEIFSRNFSRKHLELAKWCAGNGLVGEARKEFSTAQSLWPDNPDSKSVSAVIDAAKDSPGKDAEYAQKVKLLAKDKAKSFVETAKYCAKNGMQKEFEESLKTALQYYPEHDEARELFGFVKYKDQWVDLKETFKGAVSVENLPKVGFVEFVYDFADSDQSSVWSGGSVGKGSLSGTNLFTVPFANDLGLEMEMTSIPADCYITKIVNGKPKLVLTSPPTNISFELREDREGKNKYEYIPESNGVVYKTLGGMRVKQIARANVSLEAFEYDPLKPYKFGIKRKGNQIQVIFNGKVVLSVSDGDYKVKYLAVIGSGGTSFNCIRVSGRPDMETIKGK